jgi:hypothetical protein
MVPEFRSAMVPMLSVVPAARELRESKFSVIRSVKLDGAKVSPAAESEAVKSLWAALAGEPKNVAWPMGEMIDATMTMVRKMRRTPERFII